MSKPPKGKSEPALFSGTYVTGPDYAVRVSRAFFRYVSFKPRSWVPSIVATVALFVIGREIGGLWWLIGFVGIVVFVASIPLAIRRTRARFRAVAPTGSTYSMELRPASITVRSPLGRAENSYQAYESMIVGGGFVFLRLRASKMYTILPAELFVPESVSWLADRILLGAPAN